MYTIKLADGRELSGLGKNGTNFVSNEKVDESIFKDNLSTMTVSDGETEETFTDMAFIQQMKWMDGTYYLAFRQKTPSELTEEMTLELLADYEYRLCMLELG